MQATRVPFVSLLLLFSFVVSGVAHADRWPGHPRRPGPGWASMNDFVWSYSGPVPGGYCANIVEPSDPHAWNDNFLCSRFDYGMRWSFAGPIPGMACVNIVEPSDPDAWADNYLCTWRDIGLRWSFAGPIPGMNCLQVNEPAEPYNQAWQDNYLCLPF